MKQEQSTDAPTDYTQLQTVIDALTANIAVLNVEGIIVAVNRAWVKFSEENGGSLPRHGVGQNYFEPCGFPHKFQDQKDDNGVQAAQGINDVMGGIRKQFQFTYPCHSPDEQRWFMLTASPLNSEDPTEGVILTHENITTLMQQEEAVSAALVGTVEAISVIAEARDPYTAGHQRYVAQLSQAIAEQMGFDSDQCHATYLAASVHDIGKIAIPLELLIRPGKLNDNEMDMIRTHSQAGHDILCDIPFPWPLGEIVLQHHERLDGSGYPNKLQGDEICIEARIIAIADTLDAISSHRPYRPARGVDFALNELQKGQGQLYDSQVVDALGSAQIQQLLNEIYG